MRKIFFVLLAMSFIACKGSVNTRDIIEGIPCEVPQFDEVVRLDAEAYTQRVSVLFDGSAAQVLNLPEGVTVTIEGADVAIHSQVAGVEFVVGGSSDNGSLAIASEQSPLVTFDSLVLCATDKPAVSVSSAETVFFGGKALLGDRLSEQGSADKQSATIQLAGNAVLLPSTDLVISSTRCDAVSATGHLYVNGALLHAENVNGNAISVANGVVVIDGDMVFSSDKNIIDVENGDFVMTGGNISLASSADKVDAISAENIYIYGGNLSAHLCGMASKGLKTTGTLFLMGGNTDITTSGGAVFSDKKGDYSSSACIRSGVGVYIKGGSVSLASEGDTGKGISCDGRLQIDGGDVLVKTAGNDVNHPDSYNLHSSAKGIKCTDTILVNGGNIRVLVMGTGERCEGVESKSDIIIGGDDTKIYVYAYDDAINSGGDFVVEGGKIYAYSVANDAVDSNAGINISGGLLIAIGTHSPEQGIDTDFDTDFTLTGGTVLSLGGTMGPAPCIPKGSDTDVPVVAWSGLPAERDKYLNLVDETGNVFLSYCMPRTLPDAAVLLASPVLHKGGEYSLFVSDGIDGGESVGCGLFENAKATDAETVVSWKQSATLSLIDRNGAVEYIEPDTIKSMQGFPPMGPPPGGGDFPPMNGDFPAPPGGGGFPPMNGDFPAFPDCGFPPMDGGFHFPGFGMNDNEIYTVDNLPGKGW